MQSAVFQMKLATASLAAEESKKDSILRYRNNSAAGIFFGLIFFAFVGSAFCADRRPMLVAMVREPSAPVRWVPEARHESPPAPVIAPALITGSTFRSIEVASLREDARRNALRNGEGSIKSASDSTYQPIEKPINTKLSWIWLIWPVGDQRKGDSRIVARVGSVFGGEAPPAYRPNGDKTEDPGFFYLKAVCSF